MNISAARWCSAGSLGLMLTLLCFWMGCAMPRETGRAGWLQNTLLEDNRTLLLREPVLVEGKFAKMASSIYNYFRGTATVYTLDSSQPGPALATRYGTSASNMVSALLDPHPENIGSYRNAKGEYLVDFNDFDGATFAPYHFDVRRLALGFAILLTSVGTSEAIALQKTVMREVAQGYAEHIREMSAGKAGVQIRRKGFGFLIDDLLKRAEEQGNAREELELYTIVKEGRRVISFGEKEPAAAGFVEDVAARVTAEQQRLLRALMKNYQHHRLPDTDFPASTLAIKGMLRKLGSGVSSYPRLRFYVLVEGRTSDVKDDLLLEFKELAAPAPIPNFLFFPRQSFMDNGERAVALQRQLQESPRNDRFLGWAVQDPMLFRVRQYTKYQKNFSSSRFRRKLREKKWGLDVLPPFARLAGRLLARAHANATTLQGNKGLASIAAAIGKDSKGFVEETVRVAMLLTKQTEQDFQTFLTLLKDKGPRLGFLR